ncbi:hypothetical protein Aduo_001037 [Ancylostoma duodenale]
MFTDRIVVGAVELVCVTASSSFIKHTCGPAITSRIGHRPVYHPGKGSGEKFPGYPGHSKSGTDSLEEYKKRGSLSDEYKRRVYEEATKAREPVLEPGAEGYSPECYLFSLVVTASIIGSLVAFIVYVSKLPREETFDKPVASSYIVKNKAFTVISESLDCSLYIK